MLYLHRANSLERIEEANEREIGVELDVRLWDGEPVLSHEPLRIGDRPMSVVDAVALIEGEVVLDFRESEIVAPVVKALQGAGQDLARFYAVDLFVPDMLVAERLGLKTLARWSAYERIEGPFWGRWVDYAWAPGMLTAAESHSFLVSPELHRHDLDDEFIEAAGRLGYSHICTGLPDRWAA
jgi:hypothetical protein